MVFDSATETAILLFSNETLSGSPGGQQHLNTVAQITSTDAGLTWTQPVEVNRGSADWPAGWAPTSGNGIQLRHRPSASTGGKAGRLLFSMDTSAYGHDSVLFSDSAGESYTSSEFLNHDPAAGLNEFQMASGSHLDLGRAPYVSYGVNYVDLVSLAPFQAELSNGSVLAVFRNNLPGKRMEVSVSDDGGETFGAVRSHPDLPSPICQGSVLAIPAESALGAGRAAVPAWCCSRGLAAPQRGPT